MNQYHFSDWPGDCIILAQNVQTIKMNIDIEGTEVDIETIDKIIKNYLWDCFCVVVFYS